MWNRVDGVESSDDEYSSEEEESTAENTAENFCLTRSKSLIFPTEEEAEEEDLAIVHEE